MDCSTWPEYLIWLASSDAKHFGDFRLAEVSTLLDLFGINTGQFDPLLPLDCPYIVVRLPNDDICHKICDRSVLIESISRIWARSQDLSSLPCQAKQYQGRHGLGADIGPGTHQTFCIRVKSFGNKVSQSTSHDLIHDLVRQLQWQAKIQLKHPDLLFNVYCHYDIRRDREFDPDLRQCFFVRNVANRKWSISDYSLKTRAFIGPTSTDAALAQLMANQVQAVRNSLIMDPFVGTGSLLIACASFGAKCIGSDIDWNTLHPKDGKNCRSNFDQYGLDRADIVRSDNAIPVWRSSLKLDGIITDPPYGIRAGARRSGSDRQRCQKPVPEQFWPTHHPPTRPYAVDDVMRDLLELGARHLRPGGRLVYLLPADRDFTDDKLPRHPMLRLIANSEQICTGGLCRRLITMAKVDHD